MKAKDKLIRAKIKLNKKSPFFSYLTMFLKLKEKKEVGSCGVDNKSNFYYNPEFIQKLDEEELKGVLAHEVLHLAFQHLWRKGNRNHMLFNIATDLVVNDILLTNNFSLPEVGIIPHDHKIEFQTQTIRNIHKKSFEEIYDEFPKLNEEELEGMEGFDEHYCDEENGDEEKGKDKGESEGKDKGESEEKKWKKRLVEAGTLTKQQGKLPDGMERQIDEILESKINWKQLLYKYVTNQIPFDYSYNYPSKKSRVTGVYMPSVIKENLECAVSIDTSGSITQEELRRFVSEIIRIAKSFNNVNITVIICDAKVQNTYEVKNGNKEKIRNIEIKGGGGTDHRPIYKYLRKNKPNTSLLINFTDGMTDFPEREEIRTLWVLPEEGVAKKDIPFGDVIKIR